MDNHVADVALADDGRLRVDWALGQMPVLAALRERFAGERPFAGLTIAACLHVTAETAGLVGTLRAGGATVLLCGSNPLSTQDDVAACLASEGVGVFAVRGEDHDTYYRHIAAVLDAAPQFTIDDGADLVSTLHRDRPAQASEVIAGAEETTTGVVRLRRMAQDGALRYPVVAVNDTPTKHLFDNRFGTGQSALDGIIRATNVLVAGSTFVVAGYGFCGRGLASRARGLGANVVVTEVDEIRALEAVMDGFRVMPMSEAAAAGDVFCTVTGDRDVIRTEHVAVMKDGAILANAGHFDVEIDVAGLRKLAVSQRPVRRDVEELTLADGRRINLLAEGRLVNLGAAEGHPAAVMDMSFAAQALTLRWLAVRGGRLDVGVHDVPHEIDREVARLKLASLGARIDSLTARQRAYLGSWTEGT